MDKPKVFISVGSNGTPSQREATDAIFATIAGTGLAPRQMEKNEWSSEQPLRAIRKVIEECHGAVIVAFARYEFPDGFERLQDLTHQPLKETRLPTVWNQIEAALAYGKGLPLLVIGEQGLREDGLFEGRYDWRVFWTEFDPADLRSERFSAYFSSWKKLVDEHVAQASTIDRLPEKDLSKIPFTKLLALLTLPQIIAILGALGSALAATATAAYKAGGGKWPWQ